MLLGPDLLGDLGEHRVEDALFYASGFVAEKLERAIDLARPADAVLLQREHLRGVRYVARDLPQFGSAVRNPENDPAHRLARELMPPSWRDTSVEARARRVLPARWVADVEGILEGARELSDDELELRSRHDDVGFRITFLYALGARMREVEEEELAHGGIVAVLDRLTQSTSDA